MASKTRSEIFAEQLANVTTSLQSKYDLALKEADDSIPAKMEVKQLSFNVNSASESFRDKSSYSYLRDVVVKDSQIFGNSYEYTIPKTKEAAKSRYENVVKELDEKFKKVETDHQDNLIAIQNNKLIHEKVQVFMQKVGISQHYTTYEFKTSRSSKRTSVGHIAGWAEDLRREVRTSDGYEGCVNTLKKSKEDLEAFYKKLLSYYDKQERESAKKEKDSKDAIKLATLRGIYTPFELDSDLNEVLNVILSKDKYLNLAHAGKMSRNDWNDWNDCYEYVENALGDFEIECNLDSEIVKEYNEILEADDGHDGRVFRDCNFNYTVLFGYVKDANLLAHYQTAYDLLQS